MCVIDMTKIEFTAVLMVIVSLITLGVGIHLNIFLLKLFSIVGSWSGVGLLMLFWRNR